MRLLRLIAAGALVFACIARPTFGQVPAQVNAQVSDRIGLALAEAIATWLERERYFAPADPARPHVEIQLATIDPSVARDGAITIYSAVINWHREPNALPWFIGHVVGACTFARVDECAASIGQDLRRQSERIERAIRDTRRAPGAPATF